MRRTDGRILDRWFLGPLGIERSEVPLVALPMLCLIVVGWADVSLANVAETFFLKRVGVEFLPIAWLPSLMLLVATSYFVGRVVAPRDHLRALPAVFIILALCLVGLWGFLQLEVSGNHHRYCCRN